MTVCAGKRRNHWRVQRIAQPKTFSRSSRVSSSYARFGIPVRATARRGRSFTLSKLANIPQRRRWNKMTTLFFYALFAQARIHPHDGADNITEMSVSVRKCVADINTYIDIDIQVVHYLNVLKQKIYTQKDGKHYKIKFHIKFAFVTPSQA